MTVEDVLADWNLIYSTCYRPSPLPPLSSAASSYLTRAADKDLQELEHEVAIWKGKSNVMGAVVGGEELTAFCKEIQCNFIDMSFPPYPSTLTGPQSTASSPTGVVTSSRRASHFLPSSAGGSSRFSCLFGPFPPTRVSLQQGALGDCWLVSALTALSERPRLIENAFPSLHNPGGHDYGEEGKGDLCECSIIDDGYVSCLLYLQGIPCLITLDTYLPCYPLSGPLYCKSPCGSTWAPMVEKAFAKAAGGYMNLVGGYAYEGMMDVTGCPTYYYSLGDYEVKEGIRDGWFWKDIMVGAMERRWLMTCTTRGESKNGEEKEGEGDYMEDGSFNGLVSGHAYTILWCGSILGHSLLHIRNPWGGFEWRGDWSKGSLLWTKEAKEEVRRLCGEEGGEEGSFWMSVGDWVRRFESVSICMVTDSRNTAWNCVRKKIVFRRDDDSDEGIGVGADKIIAPKAGKNVGWTEGERDPSSSKGASGLASQYPLRCPVYRLAVSSKTDCVITIHNRDVRLQEGGVGEGDYPPVGVSLIKQTKDSKVGGGGFGGGLGLVGMGAGGYQLVGCKGIRKERQVQTEMMEVRGSDSWSEATAKALYRLLA